MQANREWISISDLMAGLMMVFLFIAIAFMLQVADDKKALADIAVTYDRLQRELNHDLLKEFKNDLEKWGAEIFPDNIVRFNEPDVLFARNKSDIKKNFRDILDDFFPRYINILTKDKYKKDIEEIRIEGHTSSLWHKNATKEEAYLSNARLSQDRSFSVLSYVYMLDALKNKRAWLIQVIRANGLSYAKLIQHDGVEDRIRSRRVEFRVITKAEQRIMTIVKKAKETQD